MVYPAVVINRRSYRGQIDPLSVFNAICAAFKEAPDQCAKTLHRAPNEAVVVRTNGPSDMSIMELVGMFIGLVAVNGLVLYCYRRKVRRDAQADMQI
jgi:hypothetical protein